MSTPTCFPSTQTTVLRCHKRGVQGSHEFTTAAAGIQGALHAAEMLDRPWGHDGQKKTFDSCLRRSSTSYECQDMKRLAMYINKGTSVVLCFFHICNACTLSCTCLQYKLTGWRNWHKSVYIYIYYIVYRLICWVVPPPSKSHHQDYEPF